MADLGAPLNGGFLNEVPPNATREVQISTLNDIIRRLNELLKTQIFSDGSNRRMLFGFQKNGWGEGKDFGIKISEEGVDITTATDDQLIFKMDMDTWLWSNGSVSTAITASYMSQNDGTNDRIFMGEE